MVTKGKCQRIAMVEMPWQQLYSQLLDILSTGTACYPIENDVSSVTVWPKLILRASSLSSCMELVDLLGFSNLDLIQELLANRQAIVEDAQS